MEYLLTNAQMRKADEYTINVLGTPSFTLMERAGAALAREAEILLDLRGKRIRERVLCVCGGGNNGGDGFVCARILLGKGIEADVVFFAERTSADCAENKEKFLRAGGKILSTMPTLGYAVIVDCLLGTGFKGALSPSYRIAVDGINRLKEHGAKVLSADVPSGVNGDNGEAEIAVWADKTLCIGEKKAGVYLGDGIDHAGEILREDIGICLPENIKYAKIIDGEMAKTLLPVRKRHTHKGTFGKAAIVAGSMTYSGSALLTTSACLRSGAGYTTLFTPSAVLPYYIGRFPEAILQPISVGESVIFDEEYFEKLLDFDAVAYGVGMGESRETAKGAAYLLENYTGKLILDADGLNSLAKYKQASLARLFANKKCETIVTPHVKEFSRLTKKATAEIVSDGLFAATPFAKEHKLTVLLKNAVTLITDGEEIFVNTAGTSGQAKGGSGDALTGVIVGLCSSGVSVKDGGVLGAYITGRAAELAAKKFGAYSLTASDVIAYMPAAFLEISAK